MNYNQRGKQWLANELDKRDKEIHRLRLAMKDIAILIDNSQGVAGLHLNGDVAKWSDLLIGGRFEEWLSFWQEVYNEI